jgi:hypothetical protein
MKRSTRWRAVEDWFDDSFLGRVCLFLLFLLCCCMFYVFLVVAT